MGEMTTIQRQLSPDRRALAEQIIEQVEEHGNVKRACAAHSVPHPTFYDWLETEPFLADRLARARIIGTSGLVDDALSTATDPTLEPQHVGRARLAWDATKWYASKQDPDRFGDKTRTELTGKDGGAIQTETTTRDPIVSELAALLRQAKRPGAVTIDATPIAQATKKPEAITPPAPAVDDISDLI